MKLKVKDAERCVGCETCMFACSRRSGSGGLGSSSIGIRSAGGMSKGFVVVICRSCDDPPCAKACPTGAITVKKTGGVKVDKTQCIGCEDCRRACILKAVFWNNETQKPLICVQCGTCVKYCSHGVLELQK